MTDDELRVLDGALLSSRLGEAAMDVCRLQGFATALVIGPHVIPPSVWLPWVWDMNEGRVEPGFENLAQAGALTGEVVRLYNEMASVFATTPAGAFEPLFLRAGSDWRASAWCDGFVRGMKLSFKDWSPLIVGAPNLFEPIHLLAGSDARLEELTAKIVPVVQVIAAHWRAARSFAPSGLPPMRRDAPKLGRNDPCHCGSGLKYKKCHGAN